MRQPRIKISGEEEEAVYHCMTRTVNGERIIDDVGREVLRKQLWQISDYCGVQVITYALLSNHFHVLVRVPQKQPLSDEELLRRYNVLYPKPTRFQTTRLEVIRAQLAENGPDAIAWRKRQNALMGDVSQFMKLLKQRFAIWFNKTHQRYGTLWAERFKSVLVEPHGRVLEALAAYIDLNCVRAGLASDPKDYRFCGYSEAIAGHVSARNGLMLVFGARDWNEAQSAYRQVLFGTGADGNELKGSIAIEEFRRVIDEGGKLPLSTVLRCRVRYFSDGAVLGSKAFVGTQLAGYRKSMQRRTRSSPKPLPAITDSGELATLRGLRRQAFG
ncbi:MAG TPA: transposase [Opitutaceae bacterium]|nr:transposase [Opitutaceae bacterium]